MAAVNITQNSKTNLSQNSRQRWCGWFGSLLVDCRVMCIPFERLVESAWSNKTRKIYAQKGEFGKFYILVKLVCLQIIDLDCLVYNSVKTSKLSKDKKTAF